jgi:hypothetical protein
LAQPRREQLPPSGRIEIQFKRLDERSMHHDMIAQIASSLRDSLSRAHFATSVPSTASWQPCTSNEVDKALAESTSRHLWAAMIDARNHILLGDPATRMVARRLQPTFRPGK